MQVINLNGGSNPPPEKGLIEKILGQITLVRFIALLVVTLIVWSVVKLYLLIQTITAGESIVPSVLGYGLCILVPLWAIRFAYREWRKKKLANPTPTPSPAGGGGTGAGTSPAPPAPAERKIPGWDPKKAMWEQTLLHAIGIFILANIALIIVLGWRLYQEMWGFAVIILLIVAFGFIKSTSKVTTLKNWCSIFAMGLMIVLVVNIAKSAISGGSSKITPIEDVETGEYVKKELVGQADLIAIGSISQFHQWQQKPDGTFDKTKVYRDPDNPNLVGVMRIDIVEHQYRIKKSGLDVTKLEDNVKMAKILYKEIGIDAWRFEHRRSFSFTVEVSSASKDGTAVFKTPKVPSTKINVNPEADVWVVKNGEDKILDGPGRHWSTTRTRTMQFLPAETDTDEEIITLVRITYRY